MSELGYGDVRQTATIPMNSEDKEHVVNLAKYMLTTDLPEELRSEFSNFFLLYDKDFALANLERRDLPYFDISYELIVLLLECGLTDYAYETMIQCIRDLKLTRSVDALQLKLGVSGVSRSETVSRIEQDKIKRSMGSRIASAFRRPQE